MLPVKTTVIPQSKFVRHSQPVKQLRIAYLISEYPALSHTFIANEIAELEQRGHDIFRVSIRRPASAVSFSVELSREASQTLFLLDAVPASFLPALARLAFRNPRGLGRMLRMAAKIRAKARASVLRALAYFAEAVVLRDRMLENELDHVHNHFGNAAAFPAMIAAESGDLTYSLSIHGPDVFYQVDREMLAEKVSRAAFTRCISDFCRSQLCLITDPAVWDRFEIVRCGVDPSRFHPAVRFPKAERSGTPEILCVGRLVPAKGQHILLQASALLHRRGLAHQLTFVGAGPDQDSLQVAASRFAISEHVTFTGGLPPSEVHARFQGADLFVLPSFAEGVPVVLMEAMAMEIPVISTTIAGIPELIEDGRTGRLTAPGCVESLACAIGDFLVQPDEWQPLARAGRERVLKDYHQIRNGAAMVRLFEKRLPA